jgi:hypothetical protein
VECVEKIIQRRPESLPYGIAGPSRVSGSQEQPIILSSDEDIKIKTEKDTIEKDTIEKVTIEKVTEEDTEKVIEEDTEKVTEEDTGSKKTVSKAFYFFLFLLFASHKFFF